MTASSATNRIGGEGALIVGRSPLRRAVERADRELEFRPANLPSAWATRALPTHPKVRSPGALNPKLERAILFDNARAPSTNLPVAVRANLASVYQGARSLYFLACRHKLPGQAPREFANRLPGLLGLVGFHGHNHGDNQWKNLSGPLSEKFGARA